jgi:hypothetical protein
VHLGHHSPGSYPGLHAATGDAVFCVEAGDLLAGLRGVDDIMAGLTSEPRHLLGALDSATELLGSAG